MRRLLYSLLVSAAFTLPATAATVDGLKIHSAVTGQGKQTVIFIHGWTCDSSSWQSQVPEFARKYRVVTVDLPGHGKSGSPADGKFSMDLFARAVEAVREEVKADKVVLVGHSMGAPVIRQYARLYPQHVAALVAVDGPLVMTGFGGAARGDGPPRPQMTGPEGLKARENMIRGMFTPQTPPATAAADPRHDAEGAGSHGDGSDGRGVRPGDPQRGRDADARAGDLCGHRERCRMPTR